MKPRQQGCPAVLILIMDGYGLRIDSANLRGLGNT